MRRALSVTCLTALLIVASVAAVAPAEVKLPGVFGEHMVLQRGVAAAVWGWETPGGQVTVSIAGQTKSAKADEKGNWSVKLDALKAGGPHVLKVAGSSTVELADVLVGEVWLCSGQSNMAMSVSRSKDFESEKAAAALPGIRMMTVSRTPAETPQTDCKGAWAVCSPATVGGFSATAYFFGRKLHKDLGVPVGLINSSWGGTPVQSWTCIEDQQAEPKLKELLDGWKKQVDSYDPAAAKARYQKQLAAWQEKAKQAKAAGRNAPRRPRMSGDPRKSAHRPANLYNGMIAPLAPYAIRGGIWYQGESNAGRYNASLYGMQLSMMIGNWRRLWGQGDFPFEWVQLPNFRAPQKEPVETDGWVIVQEEMLKTLKVPNTGMAVTIDVGEAKDIHPKNKQDVGKRLALWALAKTYGKDVIACGPLYKSMSKAGGKITVTFDHVGGGLVAKGDKLEGFAVAGADKKFVWADAKIDGDKVVVSSAEVADPAAVRYAWAVNPKCSLANKAGLPASPFRTDDWDLTPPK
jgi:sialate O-acetylesterase